MARLISFQLGNTTVVQLDHLAFFRFQVSCVRAPLPNDNTPHLGLVLIYPPGSPAEVIALCRLAIPAAADKSNLDRIASVMLAGGTLDKDLDRTRESFQMLKNNPQCKGDALELSVSSGVMLVEAYWKCRQWSMEMSERIEIPLKESTLLLVP